MIAAANPHPGKDMRCGLEDVVRDDWADGQSSFVPQPTRGSRGKIKPDPQIEGHPILAIETPSTPCFP